MRRIKTASRFNQAEIAFVNQVEQRHAETAKALGIANHHAQVRLHETAERNLITVLLNLMTELVARRLRVSEGKVAISRRYA